MLFAVVGDTTYNIVLLLHILTAIVAFAPAFVHPILTAQGASADAAERSRWLGFMAQNGRRVYGPALIVTGVLGFALQGLSDGLWEFEQTWIVLAVLIWVAMNGIVHAVILPAERALAGGDERAQQRLAIGGATVTVLLVVMLYLMIWKPGF